MDWIRLPLHQEEEEEENLGDTKGPVSGRNCAPPLHPPSSSVAPETNVESLLILILHLQSVWKQMWSPSSFSCSSSFPLSSECLETNMESFLLLLSSIFIMSGGKHGGHLFLLHLHLHCLETNLDSLLLFLLHLQSVRKQAWSPSSSSSLCAERLIGSETVGFDAFCESQTRR